MSKEYEYQTLRSCGVDTFISQNVEIRRPHLVSVGSHSAIDSGFYCTVSAEIGDYVHIGPYVTATGGSGGILKMSQFTNLAAGSRVICVSDEFRGYGLIGPPTTLPDDFKDRQINAPVVFERFANVGANAIIMPGVILAEGCVIGAGALVTRSTEPWKIYVGHPARPIRSRPKERILGFARDLGY